MLDLFKQPHAHDEPIEAGRRLAWPAESDLSIVERVFPADPDAFLRELSAALLSLVPPAVQRQIAEQPLVPGAPPQHRPGRLLRAIKEHPREAAAAEHVARVVANALLSQSNTPSVNMILSYCSALSNMNDNIEIGMLSYFLLDEITGISDHDDYSDEGRKQERRIPLAGERSVAKKHATLRVPPNLLRLFDKAAAAKGLTRTDWMTEALVEAARAQGIDVSEEPSDASTGAKVAINFALPETLRPKVDEAARHSGLPRNSWLEKVVRSAISENAPLRPTAHRYQGFKQLGLTLSPDVKERVDHGAQTLGVPRNRWIVAAIEWALDQPIPAPSSEPTRT